MNRGLATALVVAAALLAPASAPGANLHRTPGTVHAGERVRVFGSVAGGCAAGSTVTLISPAFRHTQDFAGQPAVFTPSAADGTLNVPVGATLATVAVAVAVSAAPEGSLTISLTL